MLDRIRTRAMISHAKIAKFLIQEQEQWFIMKRLRKSWFKNKNDDLSWKDSKSLDSRIRTILYHEKDWKSLNSRTRTMIYHEKSAKVLIQEQERWYLIKIQYFRSLDSRKERLYLTKRQQKSCSRKITLISREMTAKVLIQEQERWRWYFMKRLQKSWFRNKNDDLTWKRLQKPWFKNKNDDIL